MIYMQIVPCLKKYWDDEPKFLLHGGYLQQLSVLVGICSIRYSYLKPICSHFLLDSFKDLIKTKS